MQHLLDVNKTLNIILSNQYKALKEAGHIADSVGFAEWLNAQNIIIEPVVSLNIREVVYNYYMASDLYRTDLQAANIKNFNDLLTDADLPRKLIYIKQVSIYLYYEFFGKHDKMFSYADIATLHNTSKQNAMAGAEKVKGYIDVSKTIKNEIEELTALITAHVNNNTLKLS